MNARAMGSLGPAECGVGEEGPSNQGWGGAAAGPPASERRLLVCPHVSGSWCCCPSVRLMAPWLTPARETFWAGPGPDAFSWGRRRGAWRRRAVPAAVCRGGAGGPHSACGSPRPAREPPRARGRGEGAPRGVGAEMRARPV